MEFSFNVNNLLADSITKLDCNITPARRNAEGYSQNELRSQLLLVIDRMGEASSKAQGLYTIITTGRKLQLSDHILYVMKDASGHGGRGTVIGILKIGHKKLFVYTNHGHVNEMEPLCVLDFYVHESRQRMGCGRKLFDYMLADMGVKACHLAIDKPSFKFSQFLNKHYNLRAEIPQVNNFVVFEGFFSNRTDTSVSKRNGRPPVHPSRHRVNASDPASNAGQEQMLDEAFPRQNTYNGYSRPPLPPTFQGSGQGTSNQFGSLGSRPPSGSSGKGRSLSVMASPRSDVLDYQRNGQLRPISNTNGADEQEVRSLSAQVVKSKGKQIYSRHINHPDSPIGSLSGSRPSSGKSLNGQVNPSSVGMNLLNGLQTRNQNSTYGDPPLLRRGMTQDEYSSKNLNLHHNYQDRRGNMKTTTAYEQPIRNPFITREDEPGNAGWQAHRDPANWTVLDPTPNYLSLAKRNYTHTRLW
ncbi:alpha-tubulin N-acetyltransferase 1-like isoform X2 [Ruditapes philippinarum]|uniref:alpha-tubulin N-acetyltransferase 1-like isoform X2 n=1 Tax=Ruditapes philippinarum TaxID=129788 RepID=UPI00295AD688|nr:alpha-tubulin N-acetyltransferase 1-like isoform X2 [Ruditapes philippinarum]